MNKKLFLSIFAPLVLSISLLVGVAGAQSFRSGDTTTVNADEVVDSSLYTGGRTVLVAGEVNGDVICGGQNVTISGHVHGDVICGGQTVNISGTVDGDIRVAGQNVTISAKVEGNVSAMSQSFVTDSQSDVAGDVSVAAEDVSISGKVGRDLAVGGTRVSLNSGVGRNAQFSGESINLQEKADIGGDLTYTSDDEATKVDGAKVAGTTTRNEPTRQDSNYDGEVYAFGSSFAFYAFTSLMLVALALALVFPQALRRVSDIGLASPLKVFLTGLIASIAAPVIIIGLMFTFIGIPLALLALIIWVLVMFLAGPAFSFYLGRMLWREQDNALLIMLIGAVVVLGVYMIPVLGAVMFLAAFLFGTGMLLQALFTRLPRPQYATTAPSKKK